MGIEPRALQVPGKCSTIELCLQPPNVGFLEVVVTEKKNAKMLIFLSFSYLKTNLTGFEFSHPPVSVSQVLGFKAHATHPAELLFFYLHRSDMCMPTITALLPLAD